MSLNVLVVDDSPVMRRMVRRSLGMCGLPLGEIHEAGNGLEALALLAKRWVDVVIADVNMPEMDGVQMVEQMAADNLIARIPVVMVSSDRSEVRMERLRQLGVRAYLTKPFRPEAFRELVEDLLPLAGALKAEPSPALLAEIAMATLEECVFVVARPAPSPRPRPSDATAATISFEGPVRGVLSIATTSDMGEELAASMLGIEPGDAEATGAVGAALAELANILCGVLAERLFGRDVVSRLGIPVVAPASSAQSGIGATLVDDEGRTLWLTLHLSRPPAARPKAPRGDA